LTHIETFKISWFWKTESLDHFASLTTIYKTVNKVMKLAELSASAVVCCVICEWNDRSCCSTCSLWQRYSYITPA